MKDEASKRLVMIVIQKNKNPLTENVAIDHMGNSVKLNELKYIENLVKCWCTDAGWRMTRLDK